MSPSRGRVLSAALADFRRLEPTEARALRAEAFKRFGLVGQETKRATKLSSRDAERQHAFMRALFDKQLRFANDPAKRKAAICGRRSGKTTALMFIALRALREYPGCTVPYIGLDRETARRIFWRPLKGISTQYGFNLRFHENTLIATAPNGGMIWLVGARDEDDIEKVRGDKYPAVLIDESASFRPHIQQLVQDVVEPALEDLDGTLYMAGTPGRLPSGMFYNVTTGLEPGWSVHRWTVLDNQCFPRWANNPHWRMAAETWLEELRKKKGWSLQDPVYLREWLGQWVEDNEILVYRFSRARNTFQHLPTDTRDWYHVMGIDFGYHPDPTAFSIGAFSPSQLDYYVLETFAKTELLADDVAAIIRQYEEKYGSFLRKVGDSAGRQFFEELNQRKGVNIVAADKRAKLDFIEHMNSDFLMGRIKVREGDPLADDYFKLIWNADRTAEHVGRPNHRTDATLYSWRESRHWAGMLRSAEPDRTTNEAIDAAMTAYMNKAADEERRSREETDTFDWGDLWTPEQEHGFSL